VHGDDNCPGDEYDAGLEEGEGQCPPDAPSIPHAMQAPLRGPAVAEEEFVQGNIFEGAETDESEHEGPTGNEGSPCTKWYRRACIVAWPVRARLSVVGLPAALALLSRAIVDGDSASLAGYQSGAAMFEACETQLSHGQPDHEQ
jgi:hypothetical protein